MDKNDHEANFKYIFKKLFKESTLLNLIILNIIFYSNATLIAVWTFQKQWQELEIPLIYFGYLWAGTNLAVAITSKYAHKVEKKLGSSITIIIVGILPIIGYLGMGLIKTLWGIGFCLLFQICRGLNTVILRDALNKRVSGDFRATANSISQMGSRTLFMLLGPLIGYLIDNHTLHKTMCYLGYFYVIVFFLAVTPLILQRKNFITIKKTN
jgi:MFS family permease